MRGKTKTIKAHDRMLHALELRKRGLSYRQIAAQTGYKSAQAAHKAVMTALQRTTQEPADEVRKLELERLDALLFGVWEAAINGDDKAVNNALRIMERRAKLLGLDAPVKNEVAGPNQGPVQVEARHEIDYSKFTTDQLRQLAAILESVGNQDGAGTTQPG